MSTKDYKLIARVFAEEYQREDVDQATFARLVDEMAKAISRREPNFDTDRFRIACHTKD